MVLKALVGRRARKLYFWAFVALLALVATTFLIVDITGAKAWEAAQIRLEEEGETGDFSGLIPPVPHPNENFFATDNLLEIAQQSELNRDIQERIDRLSIAGYAVGGTLSDLPSFEVDRYSWQKIDFDEWATAYLDADKLMYDADPSKTSAENFSYIIEKFDRGIFNTLRKELHRPHSVVTPGYLDKASTNPLEFSKTHTDALIRGAMSLSRAGIAAAQSNDTEKAIQYIDVLVKLAEGLFHDPETPSFYAGSYSLSFADRILWELIREGNLSAEDLSYLQERFGSIDIGQIAHRMYRGQLATLLHNWIYRPGERDGSPDAKATDSRTQALVDHPLKRGMINHIRAYQVSWYLDYVLNPIRDRGLLDIRQKSIELAILNEQAFSNYFRIWEIGASFLVMCSPHIASLVIATETRRTIATLSCAIERYKLDVGKYPNHLNNLVPRYIPEVPQDLFSEPHTDIHYTPQGDHYKIWSNGEDITNNDGHVSPGEDKTYRNGDDIVWLIPE